MFFSWNSKHSPTSIVIGVPVHFQKYLLWVDVKSYIYMTGKYWKKLSLFRERVQTSSRMILKIWPFALFLFDGLCSFLKKKFTDSNYRMIGLYYQMVEEIVIFYKWRRILSHLGWDYNVFQLLFRIETCDFRQPVSLFCKIFKATNKNIHTFLFLDYRLKTKKVTFKEVDFGMVVCS